MSRYNKNSDKPCFCDSYVVGCLQKLHCTELDMGREMTVVHSEIPVDLLPTLHVRVSVSASVSVSVSAKVLYMYAQSYAWKDFQGLQVCIGMCTAPMGFPAQGDDPSLRKHGVH